MGDKGITEDKVMLDDMGNNFKTTLTVQISATIEISTGPWTNDTKWDQVRKQASEAASHWTIMVKEGPLDPKPIRARVEVTAITLHTNEPYPR